MDFEVGGVKYRLTSTLDAMKQFHVSRRLAPLLKGVGGVAELFAGAKAEGIEAVVKKHGIKGLFDTAGPLFEAFGALPDADAEYIISNCLSVVSRDTGKGRQWSPVWSAGGPMFDDIDMVTMIMLTFKVLQANLAGFFSMIPSALPGAEPDTAES